MPFEDVKKIFIARERQLAHFNACLARWQIQIQQHTQEVVQENVVLSSDNRLPSLVVLISGNGGFGKSTLLKHYHQTASRPSNNLLVSSIIDCEFAFSLFPPRWNATSKSDVYQYFTLLCKQLALALHLQEDGFTEYKRAIKTLKLFHEKMEKVIDNMHREKQYRLLYPIDGQRLRQQGREAFAFNARSMNMQALRELVGSEAGISEEQLSGLYVRLLDEFGTRLYEYLHPGDLLGAALGRDLRRLAEQIPIVLFIDTYEKLASEDALLRIVMEVAGQRVGWVIAGRGDLWSSNEQMRRGTSSRYGYEELVSPEFALSIHFATHTQSGGAFTPDDIRRYFTELRKHMPASPSPGQAEIEQIWRVTQGIPLVVGLVADYYTRTRRILSFTDATGTESEIIESVIQRCFFSQSDDSGEQIRIYGLALVRRVSNPQAVMAALGLVADQSYIELLDQLHLRYHFIFTEQRQPLLHREVRHFLRLWLLDHRHEPPYASIVARLHNTYQRQLEEQEQRGRYRDIQSRFEDDQWIGTYVDLVEMQLWSVDRVAEGIRYALLFMVAASIYRQDVCNSLTETVNFFKHLLRPPYLDWWKIATTDLLTASSAVLGNESFEALEQLRTLLKQHRLDCSSSLSQYSEELAAIVCWKLGKMYENYDEQHALSYYRRALTCLESRRDLQMDIVRLHQRQAYRLFENQSYKECIETLQKAQEIRYDVADVYYSLGNAFYALKEYRRARVHYQYAIECDSDHAYAYSNLGNTYHALKHYEHALKEYEQALSCMPGDAIVYYNCANIHFELQNYQAAIDNFTSAIGCDPTFTWAYLNRGHAYAILQKYAEARADYKQAFALNPRDINAAWTYTWVSFGKEPVRSEQTKQLENIARLQPERSIAYLCRGIAVLYQHSDAEAALTMIEEAIKRASEEAEASCFFWEGIVCAYQGNIEQARAAIKQALDLGLPPLFFVPLYWLEKDRSDFFERYRELLQERFHL